MGKRLYFFITYFIFWFSYFQLLRLFFILSNLDKIGNTSFTDILVSFAYGSIMDLSMAGYLLLLPGIILMFSFIINKFWIKHILLNYTIIITIVCSLLAVVDSELYHFWGFRLDTTPLIYIKTPKDAIASISIWIVIKQIIFFLLISLSTILAYIKLIHVQNFLPKTKWYLSIVMAFFTSVLIIPIRGGLGIAPLSVGRVYFSKYQFANHAAINFTWNIGFSITTFNDLKNKYEYFDNSELKKYSGVFLNHELKSDSIILNTSKPNVIIFILESFTAKVVEPLGGLKDVTPNINKLSNEGILFSNFYASGDRSEKGLVAIMSGFPAQTSTSIIQFTDKSNKLPKLAKDLKKLNYTTSFYYGGDINFANMRAYLYSNEFDRIISKYSFNHSDYNSKWGAHDNIVIDKLFNDLEHEKEPFFTALFTLSNHEPFEIPGKDNSKLSLSEKFKATANYTDSCIGNFIEKAKKSNWWKNTLIIIVADHGHQLPDSHLNYEIKNFKIPMLWLGGALKCRGNVKKFAKQTDIPATLLSQLNISTSAYPYSKNILSKEPTIAYYNFNNGFGILTDSGKLVYDCNSNSRLIQEGKCDSLELTGKAYLQYIYNDMGTK